jgi:hypothetical protein
MICNPMVAFTTGVEKRNHWVANCRALGDAQNAVGQTNESATASRWAERS